jgi:hypothetical protein
MKKIFNYIGSALMLALAFSSCSPESFDGLSEAGLPIASDAKVNVTVDQSINQVTFNMDCNQIYPLWVLPTDGKVVKNTIYSTYNGLQKIYSRAGDYKICYRVGNRNGLSQGMGEASFHIDNTAYNFDTYINMLAGKEWRIARKVAAHLACGESGTDGTNWWAAAADEKADKGLYDDVITFSADGKYTYDPGTGGTVYVNTGCSLFPEYHQAEDYMVPVKAQTSSYSLDADGDYIYMTMPANTLFPYIPTDDAYKSPKFRLESLTPSQMVLIYDNGKIAWHYILTSASDGFTGFNASSDCNMWKNAKITNRFWYAPGWNPIGDPGFTTNGNSYTITLPEATAETWQAQCFFETDMTTNATTKYDFSATLMSTKDHDNVTVKLFKKGDDNTFYFADVIKLKAYEDYVFYKSDMPGKDVDNLSLLFDFGKNEAGTVVNISKVDMQEHKCDGIEAPSQDTDNTDKTIYTYDAATNLWKTTVDDKGTAGFTTFFYYTPDWVKQYDSPGLAVDKGKYTITLPGATSSQWQAQVHLITTIPGEADTPYDFSCTLLPTKDIKGATVKLTDTTSDDNYLFTNRVDLVAGTETVLKIPAKKLPVGAANALKLVLDFGGCPEGSEVSVYNIILQKTAK